jgi:hypothetical protein
MCLNTIHAGSTDDDPKKWKVPQEMMEEEIMKVRRAKKEHEGNAKREKQVNGFGR